MILIDNSKMKDELEIHIGMDKSEFVKSTLRSMLDEEEDGTVSLYCRLQEKGKALINDLLEGRCASAITGLVSILDEYTKLCISCFPQIAKMVDDASFRFHQKRITAVREQWFAPFYRSVLNNLDSFCETVQKFNEGDWKTAFTMIERALKTQKGRKQDGERGYSNFCSRAINGYVKARKKRQIEIILIIKQTLVFLSFFSTIYG